MSRRNAGRKGGSKVSSTTPQITSATPAQASPASTQVPVDDKAQLRSLIQALETARHGTRVITYWLTDQARISEAVVAPLYDQLCAIGRQPSIDLFLFTRGGDTEVPLRLVALIREFCDRFSVLVPYKAQSGGTLLAMGANEIVMTPLSSLGPIDPSRSHPLLPRRDNAKEAEPISVQDMRHAMSFIKDTAKPGGDQPYTPEAMAQIVTALFDKIHPLAIGAIEQSYALAKLIGTRCLGTHMDSTAQKEEIERIVNSLCDDYKSHAFMIDRKEAQEIGLKVTHAPADVDAAMTMLAKFYMARPGSGVTGKPSVGHVIQMYIAWLDSTSLQMRVEANHRVIKDNELAFVGDRWTTY